MLRGRPGTRRAQVRGRTMKLLITAVFGLVLLTGASGPGPLKDSMGNFFTSKDEVALMRGEVADLRHGRGSAAAGWVPRYAGALCAADCAYVVDRTVPARAVAQADVELQVQRPLDHGGDGTAVRYFG